MVNTNLNHRFFNNRKQLLRARLIGDIKNIIELNYKRWGIKYRDIDAIFIYGNNINGNYSNSEPLTISIFIDPEKEFLEDSEEIIDKLQEKLMKIQFHKNDGVILELVDFNPISTLNSYFDIKRNYFVESNPKFLEMKRKKLAQIEKRKRIESARKLKEETEENLIDIENEIEDVDNLVDEIVDDFEDFEDDLSPETHVLELEEGKSVAKPVKIKNSEIQQLGKDIKKGYKKLASFIKKASASSLKGLGLIDESEAKKIRK